MPMSLERRALLPFICSALLSSGCSIQAQPGRMQVTPDALASLSYDVALPGSIVLGDVTGGEKTPPMLVSKVGDSELAAALRSSLEQQGLLAVGGRVARFRLQVFLAELNQPQRGLGLTVVSVVRYRLLRETDGGQVLEEVVTAAATATTQDAFLGPTRLRIANEASIRQNISEFLKRMARIRLQGVP